MAASSHALLGASSAKRWLECPPSARAGERFEDATSEFAEEGTRAHLLCEWKVRKALGLGDLPSLSGVEFDGEMEDCSDQYAAFVIETYEKAKKLCGDPSVMVEQQIDFSDLVPGGFGTADCLIVAEGRLHVIDYKHGKGVRVDSDHNPQMMLYAIGGLNLLGSFYDIDEIEMTIFQPRLGNVSTFAMPRAELEKWGEDYVRPRAKLAWEGRGEMKEGPWCRFCKCKATCRKRAEANLELAKMEFRDPATLSDAEIAEVIGKAEELANWAFDVKDYALGQAIMGKRFPGWKIVEGRATRRFTDEAAVAQAVIGAGKDPYQKKLLSLTDMTKMLGKAEFTRLLGGLISKPQGKPTLVPESDKRPEMAVNSAEEDFKDNKEE